MPAPSPPAGPGRRTRIVATVGPACRDPAVLRALVAAGADVCRLNCSHLRAQDVADEVARVRDASAAAGREVAVLLDLQGPKIRTGPASGPIALRSGDLLAIAMDEHLPASGLRVGTTWPALADDARPGDPVLFADGAISGTVEQVRPGVEVLVRILDGGSLGAHKGINLPATRVRAPALTPKDEADARAGLVAGIDYLALSFVRGPDDVAPLRALAGPGIPIVAKIEKPEAVERIEEILGVVQGIMVARGDLGVELPFEEVPVVQKRLIAAANRSGRLVITATQMLDSMEREPRPTRAEAADVANAVFDGTDALMLSGETAAGAWPVRAVETMDRIARTAEASAWVRPPPVEALPVRSTAQSAVLRAACWAVRADPRPLVVFTWSGETAILASKSRPPGRLFAMTCDPAVRRRLALAWGVEVVEIGVHDRTDDLIAAGERALLAGGHLERGQEVVILAGQAPMRGATNLMKVEVLDGR